MAVEKLAFIQLAALNFKRGELAFTERGLRADTVGQPAAFLAGKGKVGIIQRTVEKNDVLHDTA